MFGLSQAVFPRIFAWSAVPFGLVMAGCSWMGLAGKQSVAKRDAQNLASVCASAQAAGWDFATGTNGTVEEVVAAVTKGHTINDTGNPFHGTFFGVPGMNHARLSGALRYLKFESGMLMYDSEGKKIVSDLKGRVIASWIIGLTILGAIAVGSLVSSVTRARGGGRSGIEDDGKGA